MSDKLIAIPCFCFVLLGVAALFAMPVGEGWIEKLCYATLRLIGIVMTVLFLLAGISVLETVSR